MLTTYTAYDEIRAALGVAPEEITDDVLELPNYELVLSFDLEDMGDFDPTIEATFLTLSNTTTTPSPSVDEQRFISIVKVYSAYVIARHLLNSLSMFAVTRSIAAGRTSRRSSPRVIPQLTISAISGTSIANMCE